MLPQKQPVDVFQTNAATPEHFETVYRSISHPGSKVFANLCCASCQSVQHQAQADRASG